MNAKISMFVICVKAIIYLLLYNLHDCTFKMKFVKIKYFCCDYVPGVSFKICMSKSEARTKCDV